MHLEGTEDRGHPAHEPAGGNKWGWATAPGPPQIVPQTQHAGSFQLQLSLSLQVVEAYKQGLRPAVGYELNPWLLCLSNYRAWKAGYHGKVSFLKKDLWKVTASRGAGCAQRWP